MTEALSGKLLFSNEEAAALAIVRGFQLASHEIFVSTRSLRWLTRLYLSVVGARMRGLRIRVLTASSMAEFDRYWIGMLSAAGCEIKTLAKWTLSQAEGFLFDYAGSRIEPRLVAAPRNSEDQSTGAALEDAFQIWLDSPDVIPHVASNKKIELAAVAAADVASRLKKGVSAYQPEIVHISEETVHLSDLWCLTRYVRQYKYEQLRIILDLYRLHEFDLFQPLRFLFQNSMSSIATPPVVEIHDLGPTIIGGSTRIHWCILNNIESIRAIVVRNVGVPLPGTPVPASHISLSSQELPPEVRTLDFRYELFRSIERAVHPTNEFL